ncbi:phosphoenolpyruvate--protein phosphotransferase [Albimonas pacifica]|uniref:phosphoenolpyruvate--protein phosphotransferase n=1 Tax=Albimonas pacifica TaxID=1114924 RepID=A0A1I3MHD7_9RHOB|nr:phosphoenolpyruvate--protein phosphotransferase [Albimonas pacifica]SFI96437.1 phosphotransferase system, enzyme I, PtsP [Albimonas pacifica]
MNQPGSIDTGGGSRLLLRRLAGVMAEAGDGQQRLDRIVTLISRSMDAEVCSIYLRRGDRTLELCATEGLNPAAVHNARLRVGQGLVGQIALRSEPINTADAQRTRGFQYIPGTDEEVFNAFLGVPIQRLGEVMGVLVVQNRDARDYSEDDVHGLEVVAMLLAEMTELGAFLGEGDAELAGAHVRPFYARGLAAQEGAAEGVVHLHEPREATPNPVAEDVEEERRRLLEAIESLRGEVDGMLSGDLLGGSGEHRDVLEAYRMFAHDKGWLKRMLASVDSGLAAEVAVEREQTSVRARLARIADPYLRERAHDLDDLGNRLMRHLQGDRGPRVVPENAVLVARNIGPGELLDYGDQLKGVVLQEGAIGSHAAIVARALAIPLVIQADRITMEARNGDPILVDGDVGAVHLRPDDTILGAFREKLDMRAQAAEAWRALRDEPAQTLDGVRIGLHMNAGLLTDLPSLEGSGAEGVGLYRTELQFLIRARVPMRGEQAALYDRVLSHSRGKRVVFRTLDIGSDKVLPYMKPQDEPNPALGWRAIRISLDRPNILKMQVQSLLRGAAGRPFAIMFPMITQASEFTAARDMVLEQLERHIRNGWPAPQRLEIGAMLETPSLAFAPDRFFRESDFISIGGNDLKQFFFAADRENERVRKRYDMFNASYLRFIELIVQRCEAHGTPLSYCGEDSGRPLEALALAAMGLRTLSMRPASIGPVKRLLRSADLREARGVIDAGIARGDVNLRGPLAGWARDAGLGEML